MSDPDGDTRPRVNRAELRRLRDALAHGEPPLAGELTVLVPEAAASPGVILMVCTGNICRSPMGEVLLRAALRDVRLRVHSAGTRALVDHPMTEQSLQLVVGAGADAADAAAHRARVLTPALLQGSDLVLAMTREHRSQSVQLAPAALHRAFTLREFARLAATLTDDDVRRGATSVGADPSARVRALARLVAGQRAMVLGSGDEDDVIDPYRRSQQTYDLSSAQLVPAVAEVARVLGAALA